MSNYLKKVQKIKSALWIMYLYCEQKILINHEVNRTEHLLLTKQYVISSKIHLNVTFRKINNNTRKKIFPWDKSVLN